MERDEVEGKAKEMQGKLTGDDSREMEGKTQDALGGAEGTAEDAKEKAEGAWEGAKESLDRD